MPGGIVMIQQQELQLESKATAGTMGWSMSTQSASTADSSHMRLPEKSACIFF